MPFSTVRSFSKIIPRVFEDALKKGDIIYTEPSLHVVEDVGLKFRVLVVEALQKKNELAPSEFIERQNTAKKTPNRSDPFMPCEKNLYIGEVGSHNVVLNKFPVVKNHFLLTTKEWKVQESPLDYDDFESITLIMNALDDQFCIYNCGSVSGASIIHKHVQFIPSQGKVHRKELPVYNMLEREGIISDKEYEYGFKSSKLPFVHSFSKVPDFKSCRTQEDVRLVARECLERYKHSLNSCIKEAGLADVSAVKKSADGIMLTPEAISYSHNFLLTSDWLLVVVRKLSDVNGLGFNSIAFTGEILVKNYDQLQIIKDIGPFKLLSAACYQRNPDTK